MTHVTQSLRNSPPWKGQEVGDANSASTHPLPLPRGECAVDLSNRLRKSYSCNIVFTVFPAVFVGEFFEGMALFLFRDDKHFIIIGFQLFGSAERAELGAENVNRCKMQRFQEPGDFGWRVIPFAALQGLFLPEIILNIRRAVCPKGHEVKGIISVRRVAFFGLAFQKFFDGMKERKQAVQGRENQFSL